MEKIDFLMDLHSFQAVSQNGLSHGSTNRRKSTQSLTNGCSNVHQKPSLHCKGGQSLNGSPSKCANNHVRFAPEADGLKARSWKDQRIQRAQCRILTIDEVLSKMRQSPIKVNIVITKKANGQNEKSSVYETDV